MVTNEIATLVTDAMPYLTAAAGAYGTVVLVKAKDQAADATVGLGTQYISAARDAFAAGRDMHINRPAT